jgi:hypothetical protein
MTDEAKGVKLTHETLVGLQWARRCNDEYGVGYLGPTVKRHGPLPEYAGAVTAGFLRCETDVFDSRRTEILGYFITPAGRQALS